MYGNDTRSRSGDDAESYSSWSYTSPNNNGGSGFGPATYLEGTGGGIVLITGSAKIDGAKTFDVFAGSGGQGLDRQILNARQAGTLSMSVRFNENNSISFSGFNLKSAPGTHFGDNEILSVGIHPADGNNKIFAGGSVMKTIDLGTDIRKTDGGANAPIVDIILTYDGLSGTYTLGAKLRTSSGYSFISGNLKSSSVTPILVSVISTPAICRTSSSTAFSWSIRHPLGMEQAPSQRARASRD
jgi:hypothetical protein